MTKKSKKSTVIDPGTQITIDNINELVQSFNHALKNNQTIEIKNKTLENIDLTGIQFLHYAQRRSEAEGKKLLLKLNLTDNMKVLLQNSGFQHILSK